MRAKLLHVQIQRKHELDGERYLQCGMLETCCTAPAWARCEMCHCVKGSSADLSQVSEGVCPTLVLPGCNLHPSPRHAWRASSVLATSSWGGKLSSAVSDHLLVNHRSNTGWMCDMDLSNEAYRGSLHGTVHAMLRTPAPR